jgi:hypothetical protein
MPTAKPAFDQSVFDRAVEWVNGNQHTDGMTDAQYEHAVRAAYEHIDDLDAYADLLDEGLDTIAVSK